MAIAIGIGLALSKKANQSVSEFFVANRGLPWWVVGTSIVATTFAADTPLAVSGLVRKQGIYQNWIWWNALLGGMLCTFFYAKLWRRAEILTDAELIELRYSGKKASLLRGLVAFYRGVILNSVVMGWVILAMAKLSEILLGWPKTLSVALLIFLAFFYTALSGFWGVVLTDLVQFVIAMIGAVALAWFSVKEVGSLATLKQRLLTEVPNGASTLSFIPNFQTASELAILTFAVALTLQWWANGEGNGYLAQRLFAAKDERHSVFASLWFNFAHYALRPWPWIIVGLASLVLFPPLTGHPTFVNESLLSDGEYLSWLLHRDPERAYPIMIAKFLPSGLRGIMVASLLAAFMSTMDTHLNWGASYLVNDLYRRFIAPGRSEKHYLNVARFGMFGLMLTAGGVALLSKTIADAWLYIFALGAGSGFVLLLRWYWWRINAWSEISALIGSFILASGKLLLPLFGLFLSDSTVKKLELFYSPEYFPIRLIAIIAAVGAIWLTVTFLTKPEPLEKLEAFYRKVRPGGWWGPIEERCSEIRGAKLGKLWLGWGLGAVGIYSALFGIGKLCLSEPLAGAIWLAITAICAAALWKLFPQLE